LDNRRPANQAPLRRWKSADRRSTLVFAALPAAQIPVSAGESGRPPLDRDPGSYVKFRITMNIANRFLILAAVMAVLAATADAADQATQSAVEWHVAVAGDDAQPGTSLKPFATVHHALKEVARLRAAKDDRPVAIVLHEGTHEIARPLEIGPQHAS